MKKTMTTYEIAEELMNDIYANWSRAGAFALAEYLEEYEESTGEELEFDVVAIRCDFSQYESLIDWMRAYFGGLEKAFEELEHHAEDGDDELQEKIREYIEDYGQLIEFDGGIIVSSF